MCGTSLYQICYGRDKRVPAVMDEGTDGSIGMRRCSGRGLLGAVVSVWQEEGQL